MGANYREANRARSRADFLNRIKICASEASETQYWLEVIVDACPYGAIIANEKACTAEKCNLCVHRIDEGLEPFCVICCEGQAIYFGNLNDPEDKAGRLARSDTVFQLLPEHGTDPSVFYCPPMEPRGI
jgi:Fe-S-cluster-containing dehydrogenase component